MNNRIYPHIFRNIVTILIAGALLALLIFSTYKVFSNYPFALPSIIAFYIVILTLFVFFFPLARTALEYQALKLLQQHDLLEPYVEKFLQDTDSAEDSIIAVKGEVRLIIALTIILILGIALFQLMMITGFDDFTKAILAVFTGAITSIVGFYFGAEVSKEARATKTPTKGGGPAGTPTHLSPLSVKPTNPTSSETVTFSGMLQTQDGKRLQNEFVELQKSEDNKNWYPINGKRTDKHGAYKFEESFPAGTYHFRARYSGNKEYVEANSPSTKVEWLPTSPPTPSA